MIGRVSLDIRDRVAIVTLRRPEKRNAVDPAMAREIEAAIDCYEGDPDVRAAVLAAQMAPGRPVFCAGHDLKHFRDHFGTPEEDAVTTPSGGFAGITAKERRKPLIAAVDGLATAGGCEIVLACDLVVASTRASFSIAEARWNLVASGGGGFRLAQRVGPSVALDMLLTAEPISGERAHQLGLVSRLTSPGQALPEALAVARRITSNGPLAVELSRRLVWETLGLPEHEAWPLLAQAADQVRRSDDLSEGLSAFAERRQPVWGRRRTRDRD